MSTKPPVHAAIYARISEDHQEGAGVERQVQACKELAAQASYGFAISEANIYVDNSISAYSGKKRPAFEKLLGAMAAGTVQAVLAWAPDRICRDMWDELDFREKAKRAGVRLIYVQGGELNQEDPNKVLMPNVFASVNQWESDIKSARVAAAAKQRALAGRPPGGIRKFGYSPDHMELDPKEAPALKEAVEAVLAGASVRSQAAMLNARGLVTPSRIDRLTGEQKGCNPWIGSTLRNTLLSPGIAGLVTYRGEHYPDVKAQWPAIISPDQHYAIKALLSTPERRANDRKGRGTKYLGSGLFRCGCPACNATMVTTKGRLSKTRNTTELARVYTCVDKHMGVAAPGTRHPTRNVGDVDGYVASLVVARLSDPTFLEALATANGEGMADLVEQRRDIQLRMDEIGHALGAGTLTVAQATTANKALMERLETLNNQLQAADNSGALRHLEGMEDPAVWWVTAPLETRRALLDALMTVTILPNPRRGKGFDPDGVRIEWKV